MPLCRLGKSYCLDDVLTRAFLLIGWTEEATEDNALECRAEQHHIDA